MSPEGVGLHGEQDYIFRAGEGVSKARESKGKQKKRVRREGEWMMSEEAALGFRQFKKPSKLRLCVQPRVSNHFMDIHQ